MAADKIPVLSKISESDQAVASVDEDVRGRKVTNRAGDELGKVGDLLIDEEESKVRFLLVEHGGFLGIGEKKTFIPVDAVTEITDDHVYIGQSREQVEGAPAYDPNLVEEPDYYGRVYDYYQLPPFWGAGYIYPGYPRSRTY
ncbi:PRC-barrel domain-containing protein [Streptomyces candidus]|uniref:Sporulation protein YlmC with PRC-barrel domain n=1 Tax=Streptomyces candidus TaxID=67283 RepID=A0A7X0HLR9_9ACTN|nr:PRC-barrel domain-containing protein [Streptomyces candidus]MBB6440001.1 sporulation protein YlmC with PRC-barrel domain [Streptomyces candidus]GHH57406.1 photosystem reaction center subunit H [Streptomyces candidus]